MAKKLFGNNIPASCGVCAHCEEVAGALVCDKRGVVRSDEKCLRYRYDPTRRLPDVRRLPTHDRADFETE